MIWGAVFILSNRPIIISLWTRLGIWVCFCRCRGFRCQLLLSSLSFCDVNDCLSGFVRKSLRNVIVGEHRGLLFLGLVCVVFPAIIAVLPAILTPGRQFGVVVFVFIIAFPSISGIMSGRLCQRFRLLRFCLSCDCVMVVCFLSGGIG